MNSNPRQFGPDDNDESNRNRESSDEPKIMPYEEVERLLREPMLTDAQLQPYLEQLERE